MMSPSLRTFFDDGMPCTTSSLTEVHSTQGYPRYPLNAGRTPASRHIRSAMRSRSAALVPPPTAPPRAARVHGRTAPPSHPRPAEPLDNLRLGDLDGDLSIRGLTAPGEDPVQEIRLRDGPRKSVQEEAALGVLSGQPLLHHLADERVGDQVAPLDDRRHLAAER